MPKIDTYTLSAEIVEELKRMLQAAPDDAILDYAKGDPALERGFRPGSPRSVGTVRRRLAQSLDSDRELNDELLGVLADGGEFGGLFNLLSPETIVEEILALAALCGRTRLLATLLVDYRWELRDLAIGALRNNLPLAPLDEEEARTRLMDAFAPLMVCALQWFGKKSGAAPAETGAVAPSLDFAATAELRTRIAELEAQLREQEQRGQSEKAQRKKIEEQRLHVQKLDGELREAHKQIERERGAREDLKAQMAALREQKAALERSLAEGVRAGVAGEMALLRNSWLKRPLEVEREAGRLAAAGADAGADAIERARATLQRQAEIDRASGNLATIRARVDALEAMLGRVQAARREALHPLPALGQIESELGGESERLRTLLREPRQDNSRVVERLMGRINAAGAADELMRLQRVLAELGELEALGTTDLQRLYRCCHERFARLYAAFTPRVVKRDVNLEDPVWRLKNAVEQNEDLVILLDGHNVVFTLTPVFQDACENGVPGAAARQRLVELAAKIFQRAPKCRVEIYFDGPIPARRKRGENVFEVYSGGEGEHRADRALVEQIEYFCRAMSAVPRVLVTDDRELRDRARELNTRFMPVPQFGAFLEEMCQQ